MEFSEEKLKDDILFQIDMQLYDEFNDKICEINEHLGDIYTYKDLRDIEDAEKDKERTLLREAIKKLQKEIKELKETNEDNTEKSLLNDIFIKKNYISKDKIREKIKELEKLYNCNLDTAMTSYEMFVFVRSYIDKVKNILNELLEEN